MKKPKRVKTVFHCCYPSILRSGDRDGGGDKGIT